MGTMITWIVCSIFVLNVHVYGIDEEIGRTLQFFGQDSNHTNCNVDLKFVTAEEYEKELKTPTIIGVGSCWKPTKSSVQAIDLLSNKLKPDLQLWLGDQVYADTTDMQQMRNSYDEKIQSCEFKAFMESKIPVMATWDDHDFGDNNMGKYYSKKEESQIEFLRHFNIPESDPRYNGQEGIYSANVFGTNETGIVQVILLDVRYHHSATFETQGVCEGNNATILGDEQWDWLEEQLEVESDLVIIGSGIQVLTPTFQVEPGSDKGFSDGMDLQYCSFADGVEFQRVINSLGEWDVASGIPFTERWGEFPMERERLLRLIQKSVATKHTKTVVLTSGDVHFGEIMEMKIPATKEYDEVVVREITSSGFGQQNPLGIMSTEYRKEFLADTKSNFGSIDIDWNSNEITLSLHSEESLNVKQYTFSVPGIRPPIADKQDKVVLIASSIGAFVAFILFGIAYRYRLGKNSMQEE